ncbi:alpha/beta hydrolase [bacterium]|nr:MAG: alpha/beta hydrolase [bacterium]
MNRTVVTASLAAGIVAGAAASAAAILRQREQLVAGLVPPGHFHDVDGERIHCIDQGSGPAVVLIHGLGGSTFSWREAIPALAVDHRVLAVDLPGFGFSERMPVWPLSLEQHARRVARLMDELGIGRATVIGHSMGGSIAARLAAAFPTRVERLVLVASVDPGAGSWMPGMLAGRPALAAGQIALAIPSLVRLAAKRALRTAVADPSFLDAGTIRGYSEPLLLPGTAACLSRLMQDSRVDRPVDLAGLAVPTLVVSGELDPAIPPVVGEEIANAVPGARHLVVPGVGHLVPEEQPAVFVDHLRQFLAEGAQQAGRRGRKKAAAATIPE